MRIAVLEPFPLYGGGSEQFSLDLATQLACRGHELFLTYDRPGDMAVAYDRFVACKFQLELQPFGWRTFYRSLQRARQLARLWRENAIDCVFSSDVRYVRQLALASCLSGIPVMFHLGIASPLHYRSQRIAFGRIDAGVAPSQHTAGTWHAHGWPSESLHVVSNWTDIQKFERPADAKSHRYNLGLEFDAPVACYVGRLCDYKGVGILLHAWKSVVEALPCSRLVLVGSSEDGTTEPWRQMAYELAIDRSVLFVGRVADVRPYYWAADLSIVPSIWNEPFGLTVLEAMAAGTPPIVTKVGVMPEIVGDSKPSMVVAPNDALQLSSRILGFLNNRSGLRNLGRMFSERARLYYSPEASVSKYENILRSIVHQRCDRRKR